MPFQKKAVSKSVPSSQPKAEVTGEKISPLKADSAVQTPIKVGAFDDLALFEEKLLVTKVKGPHTETTIVLKVPGGVIYKFYWGETFNSTQVKLLGTTFVPMI